MGLDKEWENKILSNPEWDIIRSELLAADSMAVFSEICWHVNNGIGYCKMAPEHVKIYLRRLDIEV
jgi:hypothetical protein